MFLSQYGKLVAVLTTAKTTLNMPVTVDYVDLTTTTTTLGPYQTYTNGVTPVDILPAPAASTTRKVNGLTIYGRDTASKMVRVYKIDATPTTGLITAGAFVSGNDYQIVSVGTTDFTLIGASANTVGVIFTATGVGTGTGTAATAYQSIDLTLQIDDTLCYTDANGWYTIDAQGNLKSVQAASATAIAEAIHGATDKATPVDADEVGIWDSVTGLLDKVSFTNLLSFFAAKLGNSANIFSVAPATAAAHAVRLDQVSLYPTVTSAASPDIFGAAGATISINNSTPVTATSFAACTSAQVGLRKKIIPVQNWYITASASLEVDGYTASTHLMPAGANIEVLATSTTTFKVTTIFAQGSFTPAFALVTPGTSNFVYATQHGSFYKIGSKYFCDIELACTTGTTAGTGTGALFVTGLPDNYKVNAGLAYLPSGVVAFVNGFTTTYPTALGIASGASSISLYATSATAASSTLQAAHIGTLMSLYGSISFSG